MPIQRKRAILQMCAYVKKGLLFLLFFTSNPFDQISFNIKRTGNGTIVFIPLQVKKTDELIMQTWKSRAIPIGGKINNSPVEVKGYKNIINLPDWRIKLNIIKKLRKTSFFPFFSRNSTRFEILLHRSTHFWRGLVLSDDIKENGGAY